MLFGSALGAVETDDKTSNTESNNKVTLANLGKICSKRSLGTCKEVSPAQLMGEEAFEVKVQARRGCFGIVIKPLLTKKVAKPFLPSIWSEMITKDNLPLQYLKSLKCHELERTTNMCKWCLRVAGGTRSCNGEVFCAGVQHFFVSCSV